ncbi:hypothetical protein [Dyella silvatica]|uniref:hypothetical protein n=1 Tax=Dyella silvatica TaxID=2992128 RepID=UPI00224E1DE3|nr:hypothetical protein [Dyella silvatica]
MKTPDIKQNPHPKTRYEITMTIDGAPGPFDAVTGFVQYKVSNDRCVPLSPGSGATLAPEKSVPLDLTRVSDKVYRATFYTDLFQDEDYYGLGVCHWSVVAATAALKVNASDLSPALFIDDIKAQKPVATYFADGEYLDARKGKDSFPTITGSLKRSDYQPESRTDIFSITLVAKEDVQ